MDEHENGDAKKFLGRNTTTNDNNDPSYLLMTSTV